MRPTFFILNLTSMIIANKNSQSQIFRTIYIGGQQYVWGYKFVGARKIYFKIYGAVKKRSQLESFVFSIFFFLFFVSVKRSLHQHRRVTSANTQRQYKFK